MATRWAFPKEDIYGLMTEADGTEVLREQSELKHPWMKVRTGEDNYLYVCINGDFLKCGFPATMGFPTKNDHFGVFLGVPPFKEIPK